MNTSGIKPQGYNVIIKGVDIERKTAGGLYIPDSSVEKQQFDRMQGTLLAVSPMAFTFEGDWPDGRDDEKPQVGDTVIYFRYSGTEIEGTDGKKYHIMRDADIAGVLENG